MMMISKVFFRCLWCIITIITYKNLTLFQSLNTINTIVYQEFQSHLQTHIVFNNVPSLTHYATVEAADTKTNSSTITKSYNARKCKDASHRQYSQSNEPRAKFQKSSSVFE
jgi:hypothetical protein